MLQIDFLIAAVFIFTLQRVVASNLFHIKLVHLRKLSGFLCQRVLFTVSWFRLQLFWSCFMWRGWHIVFMLIRCQSALLLIHGAVSSPWFLIFVLFVFVVFVFLVVVIFIIAFLFLLLVLFRVLSVVVTGFAFLFCCLCSLRIFIVLIVCVLRMLLLFLFLFFLVVVVFLLFVLFLFHKLSIVISIEPMLRIIGITKHLENLQHVVQEMLFLVSNLEMIFFLHLLKMLIRAIRE
mmetsp:Transcript_30333/g.48577  ORF Transcript_30333/g.48577 Transcript_30333/m.48577 type:complete len:234 (-) Transcript_30333:141-842(-)